MFHKNIPDEAHIFVFNKPRRVAITMVFVFIKLDAILLDENKKIVHIIEEMRPWREYYPKDKCQYFIELQAGTVKKEKLKINDLLDF